ncbi:MAG: hypothetical protein US51_C0028G0010 [Microgenomates group bacterium GW2011_GWA2_37_6]|nr:MAG: hypothetical protein US51_C0028G0010 [Microgenomates group bacterium GW2011_GWA2_37_6]
MTKEFAFTIPGINGGEIKIETAGGIPEGGLLTRTLPAIITYLLIGATLLALAFIIFGGIKWITSGGDKTALEGARKMITYAIIGLVISFLAFFIINTIGDFFGVKLLGIPSRWCGPVVCP